MKLIDSCEVFDYLNCPNHDYCEILIDEYASFFYVYVRIFGYASPLLLTKFRKCRFFRTFDDVVSFLKNSSDVSKL